MTRNEARRLWLYVVLTAGCLVIPGQSSLLAQPPLEPGLQSCLARLRQSDLGEQLACLRRLQAAGPAASAATKTLTEMLVRSDGATDHLLIAAVLDVLRSMGTSAAPAAETLSGLLPHRSKLYTDRDKILVVRLRAYILVTLSDIGFPSSARPALLDTLAHVDQRMTAVEVGAAARAVRSLGLSGRAFAPYLLDMLIERFTEEFSLKRYEPEFPPEEATTVQLEALRALARVCSPEDQSVLTVVRQLAEDRSDELDPRVVREAQLALELIRGERR